MPYCAARTSASTVDVALATILGAILTLATYAQERRDTAEGGRAIARCCATKADCAAGAGATTAIGRSLSAIFRAVLAL